MPRQPTHLLIAFACTVLLGACEKKTSEAQADAVRDTSAAAGAQIDEGADAVEDRGDAAGEAIEKKADDTADSMRARADAVRERGERKADAIDAGTEGATTKTDQITTTTEPTKK